jgi:hypothetical protein
MPAKKAGMGSSARQKMSHKKSTTYFGKPCGTGIVLTPEEYCFIKRVV